MDNLKETISPKAMLTQVRKKISKDRNRFQDNDYDLDLSYITNNVIAMGFPSSGLESIWRNNIDDVCAMLKKYHGENFMIWNLSGRNYDYDKFQQKILDFGFPDHHNPPLELLFRIVLSMSHFLNSNQENVSVVHCMGGKGRTGTVIASYLLYTGEFKDTLDALQHFAQKRSSIAKGVIQASQIRYTKYFGDIINRRIPNLDLRKSIRLSQIEMNPPPLWSKKRNGCRPVIEVYSTHHYPKKLLYSTIDDATSQRFYTVNDGPIIWDMGNCLLQSDILITVCKIPGDPNKNKKGNKTKKMIRFSFHSAFLEEGVMELKAEDFDSHGSKKNFEKWFSPNFRVKMTFAYTSEKLFATDRDYAYDAEVNKLLMNMTSSHNSESTTPTKPEQGREADLALAIREGLGIPVLPTSPEVARVSNSNTPNGGRRSSGPNELRMSSRLDKRKGTFIGTFRMTASMDEPPSRFRNNGGANPGGDGKNDPLSRSFSAPGTPEPVQRSASSSSIVNVRDFTGNSTFFKRNGSVDGNDQQQLYSTSPTINSYDSFYRTAGSYQPASSIPDKELIEDGQFAEELATLIDRMESEKKRMEQNIAKNQPRKQLSSSSNLVTDEQKSKITIGKFGMM